MGSTAKRPAVSAVTVAIVATAVLAVLPVTGSWDTYAVRFAGALLALVVWLVAALMGGLRRPERQDAWLVGSLAVFALIAIVSTSLGYAPIQMLTVGNGYYMGAVTWVLIAVFVALAALAKPTGDLRSGMVWAQIPVLLAGIVVVLQPLFGAKPVGVFDTSNHVVQGFLIAAPVSLAIARAEKGGRRTLSLATAVVAILACVVSGSVAGLGAAGLEFVLIATLVPGLLGITTDRGKRSAKRGAIAVAVIAVSMALVFSTLPGGMGKAVRSQLFGSSLTTRLFLWQQGVAIGAQKPLLGQGADGFEVAVQRRMSLTDPGSAEQLITAWEAAPIAQDPHSLPIAVFAAFGLLGLVAAGSAALAWIAGLRRFFTTGQGSLLRSAFAVGVAGLAAAQLLLPTSLIWGAYVPMMVGLALVRPGAEQSAPTPAWQIWLGRLGAAVVAVAAIFLAVTTVQGAAAFAGATTATGAQRASALARARSAQPYNVYYEFLKLDQQGQSLGTGLGDARAFQRAVDSASPALTTDIRYLVLLVRDSLDQAYLSGRTDLTWERAKLARIVSEAPALPEVTMLRAQMALLDGDGPSAEALLLSVGKYADSLRRFGLYRYYYANLLGRADLAAQMRQQAGLDARLKQLLDGKPRPVVKPDNEAPVTP